MIEFSIIIIPSKEAIKQLSTQSQARENIDDWQPVSKSIYENKKINYENNPQDSWSKAPLGV